MNDENEKGMEPINLSGNLGINHEKEKIVKNIEPNENSKMNYEKEKIVKNIEPNGNFGMNPKNERINTINPNENFVENPAVNREFYVPTYQKKPVNPVMKENVLYFLGLASIYAICFAFAFYRNFIGITYPFITIITLLVCGLFLKKNNILWKKQNWWYIAGCILLGISTVITTNGFVIFFNTVGILLLITVFMIRQFYDDKEWNLGQYICNILFLYLCMIPEIASPFLHFANHLKKVDYKEVKNKNGKYILIGILIGLPMMLIIVELLSSADQIFSKFVGNLFHNFWRKIVFSPNIFLIILLLLVGFFGIYCFLSAITLNNMTEWKQNKHKRNPIIAITFLSMITIIYLIFCGIQIIFLFTGGNLLPEGYTYAEYAHQGFFQLLLICIFNLILVVSCIAIFQMSKVLKILLFIFSSCTYVMVASSAYRMLLYITVYHLSFLRVLVLWFLAMLVFLLAGVIRNIIKEDFQLFRYCMVVVSSFYLIFSFGRVDYLIASYNVAQIEDDISYMDLIYLTDLSMDAAPVLKQYNFEHENCGKNRKSVSYNGCKRCRLDWSFQKILDSTNNMSIRTFHFSKYMARKAAQQYFSQ